MKNILLLLSCVLSTGCMTYAECEWYKEADVVQTTWEEEFGDNLTDSQSDCLHAFSVTYRSEGWFKTFTGGAVGYTRQRRNGAATIVLMEGMEPWLETITLRHELTHRLTLCVLDDEYDNHQHEVFAFSGVVDTEGSLADISREYEDSVNFVCE